jgi:molybdopterin/thiamine biosynthesis adenylyltransferase
MTRFLRQQDLCPVQALQDLHITMIGTGAVGSFTALALSKMGVGAMTLYDPDTVETHNLSTQFFTNADIDRPKVEALGDQLRAMTETHVTAIPEAYTQQPLEGLVISALDSMDARRRVWRYVRGRREVGLYIDSRMGALVGQVLTVHPGSPIEEQAYRRTLHSQQEALREPCTARSVIFTVLGISSLVAGLVRNHAVGEPIPREVVQDFRLGAMLVDGKAVAA